MNPRMRNLKRFYLSIPKASGAEMFLYYENNTAGTNITTEKYLGNSTQLTIPSTIDEKTVTTIGTFTFMDLDVNITNATIPNSVTKID